MWDGPETVALVFGARQRVPGLRVSFAGTDGETYCRAELRCAAIELYGESRPGGQDRKLPRQGTRIWPLPDCQRSSPGPKQARATGR